MVVAAEDLRIAQGPFVAALRGRASRIEGVTGCTEPDQRTTPVQEVPQVLHLVGGKSPAPREDHDQIGVGQDLHAADRVNGLALLFRAGLENLAVQAVLELQLRERTGAEFSTALYSFSAEMKTTSGLLSS
jgi:hypothetical protein